jgi:hypothetical protein
MKETETKVSSDIVASVAFSGIVNPFNVKASLIRRSQFPCAFKNSLWHGGTSDTSSLSLSLYVCIPMVMNVYMREIKLAKWS